MIFVKNQLILCVLEQDHHQGMSFQGKNRTNGPGGRPCDGGGFVAIDQMTIITCWHLSKTSSCIFKICSRLFKVIFIHQFRIHSFIERPMSKFVISDHENPRGQNFTGKLEKCLPTPSGLRYNYNINRSNFPKKNRFSNSAYLIYSNRYYKFPYL
jgi:hypothetical protein